MMKLIIIGIQGAGKSTQGSADVGGSADGHPAGGGGGLFPHFADGVFRAGLDPAHFAESPASGNGAVPGRPGVNDELSREVHRAR